MTTTETETDSEIEWWENVRATENRVSLVSVFFCCFGVVARKTCVDSDSDLRVFKETAPVFILEAFGRSDAEAPHDVALGFC